MLTQTQWFWQVVTNIEENGKCKTLLMLSGCAVQLVLAAGADNEVLTRLPGNLSPISWADTLLLCHNTLPVRWVLVCLLYRYNRHSRVGFSWCSPCFSHYMSACCTDRYSSRVGLMLPYQQPSEVGYPIFCSFPIRRPVWWNMCNSTSRGCDNIVSRFSSTNVWRRRPPPGVGSHLIEAEMILLWEGCRLQSRL